MDDFWNANWGHRSNTIRAQYYNKYDGDGDIFVTS